MDSPYWESQMSGFNSGMNNLAMALIRRPQYAARNALYQAEAAKNAAMIGEVGARTGLLKTQNESEQFKLENLRNLTSALLQTGAMKVNPDGTTIIAPEAAPSILSAIAGSSKGGNDAASSIATFNKSQNDVPKFNLAQALQAKIAGDKIQAEKEKPVVAGNGSTLFTREGTPIGQAATTLAPGATRISPVEGNDDEPMVEGSGQPLPAKSSAVQGVLARAIAQITADPKLDAKAKMGTIAALKSQLGGLDDSTASQPAVTLTPDDLKPVTRGESPAPATVQPTAQPTMVRVKHPNGMTGMIPAENLEAALKQGYTQIQ